MCLGTVKYLSNFTYSSLPSDVVCIVLCFRWSWHSHTASASCRIYCCTAVRGQMHVWDKTASTVAFSACAIFVVGTLILWKFLCIQCDICRCLHTTICEPVARIVNLLRQSKNSEWAHEFGQWFWPNRSYNTVHDSRKYVDRSKI